MTEAMICNRGPQTQMIAVAVIAAPAAAVVVVVVV